MNIELDLKPPHAIFRFTGKLGFAELASIHKGGSFVLTAPGEFVKEVMVLSGIYNKFIIHESLEEAIRLN
jgi:anti-anti-sigma regulatory factor